MSIEFYSASHSLVQSMVDDRIYLDTFTNSSGLMKTFGFILAFSEKYGNILYFIVSGTVSQLHK